MVVQREEQSARHAEELLQNCDDPFGFGPTGAFLTKNENPSEA